MDWYCSMSLTSITQSAVAVAAKCSGVPCGASSAFRPTVVSHTCTSCCCCACAAGKGNTRSALMQTRKNVRFTGPRFLLLLAEIEVREIHISLGQDVDRQHVSSRCQSHSDQVARHIP